MLHRRLFVRSLASCGAAAGAGFATRSAHCHVSAEQVPTIDKVTVVASTRWVKLQTLDYTDQAGRSRKWDMATRTTKSVDSDADAVVILAVLTNADGTLDTLVVEQFRPPVRSRTVELPAGLIDKNETAEAAALRELKEETGYTGAILRTTPETCMSPGICDETVKIVLVDVDMTLPENQKPQQQLEDGEFCVVRRIPLANLRQELDSCPSMAIEGIFLLALGVELGMRLRK